MIAVVAPSTFAADRLVDDYDVGRSDVVALTARQTKFPELTSGLLIYAPNDHATNHVSGIDVSELVRVAVKDEIPILGVAAGMHDLNVALGGDGARSTPEHVINESQRRNRRIDLSSTRREGFVNHWRFRVVIA